jgi:DNA-binding transcriptional MerR regulator
MNIKTYTISQVCKEIDISQNKMRYIEEKTGYIVQRDNFGNRQYTEADIHNIKEFLRMHKDKMSYEAIKLHHYDKVKYNNFTYEEPYNKTAATNDVTEVHPNKNEKIISPLVNDIALIDYMEKMQKAFGVIVARLDTVDLINCKLDKLAELESKMDKMQDSMETEVLEINERIAEELRVSQMSQDLKSLLENKKKESEYKNKGLLSWFKK